MSATWRLCVRFLADRARLVASLGLGAAASIVAIQLVYPSISDTYAELSRDLPEPLRRMVGDADLGTPEGYLQTEAFSLFIPVFVLLVAIALGSGTIADTEERGELTLIASAPVSRRSIGAAGAAAMLVATAVVATLTWASSLVGKEVAGLDVGPGDLTSAGVNLWLLGAAHGSIAFAVGAISGRRSLAVGIATGVAATSYLVYTLLPLSDELRGGRYVSLWFPYGESQPLRDGLDPLYVAVLLGVSAVVIAAGIGGFERRDLAR